MRKRDELSDPQSCINKAASSEPIFVLRGQDMLAPAVVELWARLAQLHGANPDKVREAMNCAALMAKWEKRKFPT